MAKIREKQPDADAGRLIVDEQLEGLEARLTSIYEQTAKEVQADLDKFLSKYEKEDAKKQAMVEADEISKSEYIEWRERQIFRTNAMQAKIDDVTTRIVHADEQAMAMVNDQLPETYATSYNFGGYRAEAQAHEAGFDYTQFTVINQDAVRTLATEDPDLIPWKTDPDVEEDKRWNRQHVQNAVFQGITKGDSMPDVAKRLLPVVNMDKNAAIRTARTAVNGIENKGRKDATERVKAAGIPMVEVWSATHDQRTRDTHILLDGTEPDENGMYGKGIISKLLAYPGDPSGDPEEVYNCRCGLISQIKGIDHSKDDELYAKMMEEEYFEDWVQVKEDRQEKEEAFQKNKEGAAERVAAKQAKKEEKSKEEELPEENTPSIEKVTEWGMHEKGGNTDERASELLDLAGAKYMDGNVYADIRTMDNKDRVKLEDDMKEVIIVVDNNKNEVYIDSIFVKEKGQGTGTAVLTEIKERAEEQGFDKLTAYAAGDFNTILEGHGYNGYYSLARFGFDGEIAPSLKDEAKKLFDAETIQDLMKTEEGRNWWKNNGTGFEAELILNKEEEYKEYKEYKALLKEQDATGSEASELLPAEDLHTFSAREKVELMEHYVSDEGYDMNAVARFGKDADIKNGEDYSYSEVKKFTDDFTEMMENERLDHDVRVYRGSTFDSIIQSTGMTEEEIRENPMALSGQTIIEKGFMSTTPSYSTAESYASGNVVWRIDLPEGAKAVNQNELLKYLDSEEYTVQRNAELKIDIAYPTADEKGREIIIIQAHYEDAKPYNDEEKEKKEQEDGHRKKRKDRK